MIRNNLMMIKIDDLTMMIMMMMNLRTDEEEERERRNEDGADWSDFLRSRSARLNKGIGDAGSTADIRMPWSAIVCLGLL